LVFRRSQLTRRPITSEMGTRSRISSRNELENLNEHLWLDPPYKPEPRTMPRAMVASHPLFTGMTKGHEISTFVLHDIVGAQVPATRINKEHIVRYSAREIAEMLANGADRTDWARVDALTDEDIKRFMREDTAWGDHIDVNWAGAEVVYPVARKALSIRLDQDVIDFFQTQGRGYQTRINAVPRHFMTEKTRYKNK
jgi:uncharacterized protein (DUF4415 family)